MKNFKSKDEIIQMGNKIEAWTKEVIDNKIIYYFYDSSEEIVASISEETKQKLDSRFFDERKDLNADEQMEDLNKNYKIFTKTFDLRVINLVREHEDGLLVLAPAWQREYVWPRKQKSKLIESVLLDVPIPPLYWSEKTSADDGKLKSEVIDGQQRIRTLADYISNKFKLVGLMSLSSLNNKSFSELEPKYQDKIKNYVFRVIVITEESDVRAKLDLFERINTGSVKLTKQEVRNALFHDAELQKQLLKIKEASNKIPIKKRGKTTEYIARLLAIFMDKNDIFDNNRSIMIDNLYKKYQNGIDDDLINKFEKTLGMLPNIERDVKFKIVLVETIFEYIKENKNNINITNEKISQIYNYISFFKDNLLVLKNIEKSIATRTSLELIKKAIYNNEQQ